ncbi:MAG: response regulator [Coriobacteriia bacterium]|nr:response regulator [Coriobacteriia bacterium]
MGDVSILVADSSSVYIKMFPRAIAEADEHATVYCAASAKEALGLIAKKHFDIVIVDIDLPGVVLEELFNTIKLEIPKAYILVTSRPARDSERIFSKVEALGATECMVKPIYDSYSKNLELLKKKMQDIIQRASSDKTEQTIQKISDQKRISSSTKANRFRPELVVIAASTGGPVALESIVVQLCEDFPIPVMIVQHIPESFTESLVKNLNSKSRLKVKAAEHRELITAGTIYFAPGGTHMKLDRKNRVCLEDAPPINGVRPAADALFESIAESYEGTRVLAIILTGMGNDGRDGVAKLKERKQCYCIAQSEKSCVVYGMPRVVIESGLADEIIELKEIPAVLESLRYLPAGS